MERARELRQGLGISLTATAERAGMSPAMLSRIERGIVSPNLTTIERIAAALDVEPALLLTTRRRETVAV